MTKGGDGFVDGVVARDLESGREFEVRGKVVINATGPVLRRASGSWPSRTRRR